MQLIPEARQRRRAALIWALAASLVVHLSIVLWPLLGTDVLQHPPVPAITAELRAPQVDVAPDRAEDRVESSVEVQAAEARPQSRQAETVKAEPRAPMQAAATKSETPRRGATAESPSALRNAIAQAPAEGPVTTQESTPERATAIDNQPAPPTTSSEAQALATAPSNPPSGSDSDDASQTAVTEASPAKDLNSTPVPSIAGVAPAPSVAQTWTAFMPADNTTAAPTRVEPRGAARPADATIAEASSLDATLPPQSAQVASAAVPRSDALAAGISPETLAQLESHVAVEAAPATSATTARPFTGFIVRLRPASSLPDPFADASMKELPLRVDLNYKVFLGAKGLLIGEGTYTFEHSGDNYHIVSVAQPRGFAATVVPGQGRAESRGVITSRGLQPQEFSIERGSPDKRESADFDWTTGTVALYGDKLERFDPQTSDPMALLWQFYFEPPAGNEFTFSVATTRRVYRYTITRQGREKVVWGNRLVDAEVWRRRGDDGSADVYAWLAPSLNYAPVKLRIAVAPLGVVEALLDTMHVDPAPVR